MATPSISKFKVTRVPTAEECLHLYDILGYDVPQEDQYDTKEEYEEGTADLCNAMISFVLALHNSDADWIQQMFDSHPAKRKSEILNNIQTYLKKKKVIL